MSGERQAKVKFYCGEGDTLSKTTLVDPDGRGFAICLVSGSDKELSDLRQQHYLQVHGIPVPPALGSDSMTHMIGLQLIPEGWEHVERQNKS